MAFSRIFMALSLLLISSAYSLELQNFNARTYYGGESLNGDPEDVNIATYAAYQFDENITEWTLGGDPNEKDLVFELYMAMGATNNDQEFVMIDSRKLSEMQLKEKRLAFAQYYVYSTLNELSNFEEFKNQIENKWGVGVSKYAIVRNGDEELKSQYWIDTLYPTCCQLNQNDLAQLEEEKDPENVTFTLRAEHEDQFNQVNYSISEDTLDGLEFPEGITINNNGQVNWENAKEGSFGFVLDLIDANDWVYSNEITFQVGEADEEEGLELINFSTKSFKGGKSLDGEEKDNFVTYVGYIFNENITEWSLGGDANEEDLVFNLYMSLNFSEDFVLVDSRKLSDLELKEKRLAFAQYHVYDNLSNLNDGDYDSDDYDFLSSYAVIEYGEEEIRSNTNTDTLYNLACEVKEEDLEGITNFEDVNNVTFQLRGESADPFNPVTHTIAINENSNLPFPEGISVDPSNGWVTWPNAQEGTFSFNLRLIDQNNWYYDTPVEFTVGSTNSIRAKDLDIKYFPNPVVNSLTIEFKESKQRIIDVYDMTGSKLNSVNLNGNIIDIDLSDLINGTYYLHTDGIVFPIVKQ